MILWTFRFFKIIAIAALGWCVFIFSNMWSFGTDLNAGILLTLLAMFIVRTNTIAVENKERAAKQLEKSA